MSLFLTLERFSASLRAAALAKPSSSAVRFVHRAPRGNLFLTAPCGAEAHEELRRALVPVTLSLCSDALVGYTVGNLNVLGIRLAHEVVDYSATGVLTRPSEGSASLRPLFVVSSSRYDAYWSPGGQRVSSG